MPFGTICGSVVKQFSGVLKSFELGAVLELDLS